MKMDDTALDTPNFLKMLQPFFLQQNHLYITCIFSVSVLPFPKH